MELIVLSLAGALALLLINAGVAVNSSAQLAGVDEQQRQCACE